MNILRSFLCWKRTFYDENSVFINAYVLQEAWSPKIIPDPGPDPTHQLILDPDPDPKHQLISDPDPDPDPGR